MGFSRRGFLSMLGGLIMGKIVGPVESPAVEPKAFAEVTHRKFPQMPIRNTYLPLEIICGKTAQVLEEELKWLRLQHRVIPEIILDRYVVRRYDPLVADLSDLHGTTAYTVEPIGRNRCFIDIPEDSFSRGDLRMAEVSIRAAAFQLAEGMIRAIRARGGAETMYMAKMPVLEHLDKCVVATSEERGFSVRGMRHFDPANGRMITRVEANFGVAG